MPSQTLRGYWLLARAGWIPNANDELRACMDRSKQKEIVAWSWDGERLSKQPFWETPL